MSERCVRLYHGSNMVIETPDVSHNTGFADLGRGFYLTDDHDVAYRRAVSRARHAGGEPVVSAYELNESRVPWLVWGDQLLGVPGLVAGEPFALRFEESPSGIAAWANYIKACRSGHTELSGLGRPSVVRAWIATEEVEMVCSGIVSADDLAEFVDPAQLMVQYCLLDQGLVDAALTFVGSEHAG